MSADDAPTGREDPQDLQFDRVETTQPGGASLASPSVACVVCKRAVGAEYYAVNGKPVCANCRERVVAAAATPRSPSTLLVAALFGLGAAIAGAAIYYAVGVLMKSQWAIVAILVGYMVGWSVRKGAGGRGGRRFQILAVALTYWAVGLAYALPAFTAQMMNARDASAVTSDTSRALGPTIGERLGDTTQVTETPSTVTSARRSGDDATRGGNGLVRIGSLFLLIFALPVLNVFGSLPFGLISALIIFIGMRQAWSLTAARALQVSGPYKVGAGPAPAMG